ncbi:Zinc finger, CCCH-type [Artemisia annua]|uniref:Zinc finger, CCCH-type n=1 Tax=Artemisia annua TaxID=35608 RepID=A0A2U1PM01_ARTAN|nr:Zinc finger, CCCH-type [Artemisia annua]
MIQHPFNGGNNNNGQGEFIPHLNGSNSQIDNSNRSVNLVTQNSTPLSSAGQRPNRSSVPMSRGTIHIFYKTRLCQQFVDGTCTKAADCCNYAHGPNDLRAPPLNWQENMNNNRGGGRIECPYGDNCSYIHDATTFNVVGAMDLGRARESSVINIKTVVDQGQSLTVGRAVQVRTPSSDQDVLRTSEKGTYWKTKICNQWKTTGHCVFADKRNYAHGLAELNTPIRRVDDDGSVAANGVQIAMATDLAAAPPVQRGKWLEKLAGKLAGGKREIVLAISNRLGILFFARVKDPPIPVAEAVTGSRNFFGGRLTDWGLMDNTLWITLDHGE